MVTKPVGLGERRRARAGWLGGVSAEMLSNCAGVSGFGVSTLGVALEQPRLAAPARAEHADDDLLERLPGLGRAARSGRSGFFSSIRSSHAQTAGSSDGFSDCGGGGGSLTCRISTTTGVSVS